MNISARHIMTEVASKSNLLVEVEGSNKKKLMDILLSMMQDVHAVCVKHDIKYGLVGGTALGAVRHKGFIPWDDDFDIAMSRSDFEKFKTIFEKELGAGYIFECPNFNNVDSKTTFGKIHKKGTQLWEIQDVAIPPNMTRGIYIDVFIVENVSDNFLVRGFDALISDFWKGACFSVILWKYPSEIAKQYFGSTTKSKIYYNLRRLLGAICSIVPHKFFVNLFDKFVSRHSEETKFVTIPTGRGNYKKEIISREIWEHKELMPFEGCSFFVPGKVHEYLSNLYGNNYMQLPPVEKRERHFCVKLDFGDGQVIQSDLL